MYEKSELAVLHNDAISEAFSTDARVRQGCTFSALLFAIILDGVLCQLITRPSGITWFLTRQLENLDFAEDISLLSHSITEMQAKVDKLVAQACKVGLEINVAKTKAWQSTTPALTSNDRW